MQTTLKAPISMKGIGLHTGQYISLNILPAAVDHGIMFVRTDAKGINNEIPALWNNVVDTQLCTVIGNAAGYRIGTIEHLMSALRGCGIDNARIELDGEEVPVMDGSAMPFVEEIEKVGIQALNAPKKLIKILKEITVEEEGKRVTLSPSDEYIFAGQIDFDHPVIGTQRYETKLLNGNFKHDIAECRTFGFLHEVEWLRNNGLALGGSLNNAIVLDENIVLNPNGLRRDDEFIRHKLLDAIGDLYLAGAPILGTYDGLRAGHALNNKILHALFSDPSNYEIVESFSEAGEMQTQIMPELAENHLLAAE